LSWVLIFSLTLFTAALISERADRTVLSTAVLFLIAGIVVGYWNIAARTETTSAAIYQLADLALFTVLFTDGMRLHLRQPEGTWGPPARTLLIGLPVVLIIGGCLARYLGNLPWREALLVGAILSPTDPVFASAIVGREHIPGRLRRMLNVESGLNDGLALPLVFVLLALTRGEPVHGVRLSIELAGGIAFGLAIPAALVWLQRLRVFSASPRYEALDVFAIGGILCAASELAGVNQYLAAFVGGVLMRHLAQPLVQRFSQFGERITELLKLAALLVFGAALGWQGMPQGAVVSFTFAVLMIVVARPVSILIALAGTPVPRQERLVAAWFGPKGFASVVYGLIALRAGLPYPERVFALLAVTIALSMIVHSSTDVLVARRFKDAAPLPPGGDRAYAGS
jgi:NhaP-type Na+/H+ or K+/H+ antiporter